MWIEVFKTGKLISSDGTNFDSSAEKISTISTLYNNKVAESDSNMAPLVLGHPKDNEPAVGWVERLGRRGEKLVAKVINLTPEIAEKIKSSNFKKISISLYPDLMLRHIGLLGAASPAVKGLKNIRVDDFMEFENQIENDIEINSEVIEFTDKIKILEEENKLLNDRINQQLSDAKKLEFIQFTDRMASNNNKIFTPIQSQKFLELLELAYKADLQIQKDNSEFNLTGKIQNFISDLKPVDLIKEFTSNDFNLVADINSFDAINTIPERMKIHDKAMKIKSATKELSYEDAVMIALKE